MKEYEMTIIETQVLADVLSWTFIIAIAIICIVFFLDWAAWKIADSIDASPEEQAQREADRIARQATKEYKRRQRLRNGWFGNF